MPTSAVWFAITKRPGLGLYFRMNDCITHGCALQVNSAENRCLINPKSDTVVEKGDQLIMMRPTCIASHSYKALSKPVKATIGRIPYALLVLSSVSIAKGHALHSLLQSTSKICSCSR